MNRTRGTKKIKKTQSKKQLKTKNLQLNHVTILTIIKIAYTKWFTANTVNHRLRLVIRRYLLIKTMEARANLGVEDVFAERAAVEMMGVDFHQMLLKFFGSGEELETARTAVLCA